MPFISVSQSHKISHLFLSKYRALTKSSSISAIGFILCHSITVKDRRLNCPVVLHILFSYDFFIKTFLFLISTHYSTIKLKPFPFAYSSAYEPDLPFIDRLSHSSNAFSDISVTDSGI